MENLYLFVIWNSALFVRNRIIADLEKDYEILLNTFVCWDKDSLDDNLKAFYGHKISDVNDKINIIGTGPFNVLVVSDKNPVFGYKQTNEGNQYVNIGIFDRKVKYRKWTGGSFRIHCSSNNEEFNHDMVVLFSSNYRELLKTKIDNIKKNTITVEGIDSIEKLQKCLELFGDCKTIVNRGKLLVLAKCRLDIERFIGNNKLNCSIYGEMEGDIPNNMLCSISEDMINDFLSIEDEYKQFIISREVSKTIKDFIDKYGLDVPVVKCSLRVNEQLSLLAKLKRKIKYILAKIKYGER